MVLVWTCVVPDDKLSKKTSFKSLILCKSSVNLTWNVSKNSGQLIKSGLNESSCSRTQSIVGCARTWSARAALTGKKRAAVWTRSGWRQWRCLEPSSPFDFWLKQEVTAWSCKDHRRRKKKKKGRRANRKRKKKWGDGWKRGRGSSNNQLC